MGDDESERGRRFVEALRASVGSPLVSGEEAMEKFDGEGLGEATVVDVSVGLLPHLAFTSICTFTPQDHMHSVTKHDPTS